MSKPLGTAEWADPVDVIARHEFEDGAIWLGRSPTADETPLGISDDRHVCLVSGSRAGKGTTVIVNNLALWPGSLVVIDPKGENASITAARRGPGSQYCKGLGQAVHVLDPFNAAKVDETLRGRFNPLDALDPAREETIDEAGRIADALVVTNPEAKDPFWDESARAMVKSLILHVLTSEEFEGRRNLVTIRDLITRGDAEKVQILKDMGEEDVPNAHALLWEGASSNQAFKGVIARGGSSFANMLASSPKQYESVRQVADRNTEFMDSPGMERCLESSTFKLSELKTAPKGVSLFLSLPQRYMNTHFRWLRMMIALTITEMEATKGQPATGHRVLFCLDEFAGLKRMEVIENAVAQIAGYGVKLMFVLQSLEQLKGTYKEKWETFLSNCGIKIFFGLEDYFSREYVSKFIGEMEVIRSSRSASAAHGVQEGSSSSVSRGMGISQSEQSSYSASSSFTKSRGESSSTSHGKSQGWSKGSNWGLNLGHNSSGGTTWKPQLFFGREDERRSDSGGWSQGGNYGRSSGTNAGESVTHTHGTNTGESRTDGVSQSYSKGFSVSENVSESRSSSQSSSYTETTGINESVHKRRLVTEDEVGRLFGRLFDKKHPAYPGFALVLAASEAPIFLRKVNYFEDPQFINCFDPHPDHPFRALIEHAHHLSGPATALLENLNRYASTPFFISKILHESGEKVEAGAALFEVEGTAYGRKTASIRAPLNGRVTDIPAGAKENTQTRGFALTPSTLATITYYGEEQEAHNALRELEELAARIAKDHEQASKPAPEPVPVPEAAPPPKNESNPLLWLGGIAAVLVFVVVLAQGNRNTSQPSSGGSSSSSSTGIISAPDVDPPPRPSDSVANNPVPQVEQPSNVPTDSQPVTTRSGQEANPNSYEDWNRSDWETNRIRFNGAAMTCVPAAVNYTSYTHKGIRYKFSRHAGLFNWVAFKNCYVQSVSMWRYSPSGDLLQIKALGEPSWTVAVP